MVSVVTDGKGYENLEERVAGLKEELYTEEVHGGICYRFEQKNEGFKTAGQVQYVAVRVTLERPDLPTPARCGF